MWSNFGHQADIVLSHPNRWGKKQQKYLEEAAIQAGLVTREGAEKYLHFVEEAEAAASFALLDVNLDVKFEVCRQFHDMLAFLQQNAPTLERHQVRRM